MFDRIRSPSSSITIRAALMTAAIITWTQLTRGQDGSLLLSCMTLSFTTPRRFIPTHQNSRKYDFHSFEHNSLLIVIDENPNH
jgi:hypothetical protein